MALDLADYQRKAAEAVMAFWGNREKAALKQAEAGKVDRGARGAVTGGKNMDGFVSLVADLVHANGLAHAEICRRKSVSVLPGFFRATKEWDLLVLNEGRLIAVIEMKSQVGSFGNNFNNRTEEAVGSAKDIWVAFREGAFGDQPKPFVGWLMLVQDSEKSRKSVKCKEPHFRIDEAFRGASYIKRYEVLCERLAREKLYTQAALLATPSSAKDSGEFCEFSELTSLKNFVTSFAAHVAAEAARTQTI